MALVSGELVERCSVLVALRKPPAPGFVEASEVHLGGRKALVGSEPEELGRLEVVFGHSATTLVGGAEVVLGPRIALISSPPIKAKGLVVVLRQAAATPRVEEAEGCLRVGIALVGGELVEACGLAIILGETAATLLVKPSEVELRLGDAEPYSLRVEHALGNLRGELEPVLAPALGRGRPVGRGLGSRLGRAFTALYLDCGVALCLGLFQGIGPLPLGFRRRTGAAVTPADDSRLGCWWRNRGAGDKHGQGHAGHSERRRASDEGKERARGPIGRPGWSKRPRVWRRRVFVRLHGRVDRRRGLPQGLDNRQGAPHLDRRLRPLPRVDRECLVDAGKQRRPPAHLGKTFRERLVRVVEMPRRRCRRRLAGEREMQCGA